MNTPVVGRALFDSFNARFLEPREVADTFVPSSHFDALIRKEHTLVVGPRGSGKTTLLTMLQSEALDHWTSEKGAVYKSSIGFTGVLIPTDVSWGKQVSSIGDGLDEQSRNVFALAAFTTHILRRFVIAIEYESNRANLILGGEKEYKVTQEISNAWKVEPGCASFRSLKYALTNRLNSIKSLARQEAILGPSGRPERIANREALHLTFLDSIALGIEVFDDARGMSNSKWGLLFDELELAPKKIRNTLMASLRSVNERILFKLSLAPFAVDYQQLTDALSASAGNDYTIIQLWYSNREHSYGFCESLWNQLLRSRGMEEETAESVLGRSIFDTESAEWKLQQTAYHPTGRLAKRFRDLASKDGTFAAFLAGHKIDLDKLDTLEPNLRAATVRKATSIVAIRDAVIASGPTGSTPAKRRSREILEVYSGATSIFAMLEGNPRWFKAIIGELLDRRKSPSAKIDAGTQMRAIDRAIKRFRAMLRTIPCAQIGDQRSQRGLISLLDTIGNYFGSELNEMPFNLDPPNSFKVHSRCTAELMNSIGEAVNAGAFVLLPDGEEEIFGGSLRGKQMRLSYLFAPFYATLLRAGRDLSLSFILEQASKSTSATPLLRGLEKNDDS